MRKLGLGLTLGAVMAASMGSIARTVPAASGMATVKLPLSPRQKDGYGRRKKIKKHPQTARRASNWFRDAVYSTHHRLPTGEYQEDPRDDKYLNSYARHFRAMKQSEDAVLAAMRGDE